MAVLAGRVACLLGCSEAARVLWDTCGPRALALGSVLCRSSRESIAASLALGQLCRWYRDATHSSTEERSTVDQLLSASFAVHQDLIRQELWDDAGLATLPLCLAPANLPSTDCMDALCVPLSKLLCTGLETF